MDNLKVLSKQGYNGTPTELLAKTLFEKGAEPLLNEAEEYNEKEIIKDYLQKIFTNFQGGLTQW